MCEWRACVLHAHEERGGPLSLTHSLSLSRARMLSVSLSLSRTHTHAYQQRSWLPWARKRSGKACMRLFPFRHFTLSPCY